MMSIVWLVSGALESSSRDAGPRPAPEAPMFTVNLAHVLIQPRS